LPTAWIEEYEIRVTKNLLAESGDWRKNAFPGTIILHPYLVTLASSLASTCLY